MSDSTLIQELTTEREAHRLTRERLESVSLVAKLDVRNAQMDTQRAESERDALKAGVDSLTEGLRIAQREQEINLSRAEKAEAALAEAENEKVALNTDRADWKDKAYAAESALREKEEQVKAMREALERIAEPGCGCRPICQCYEPGALKIYREEAVSLARQALTAKPQEKP